MYIYFRGMYISRYKKKLYKDLAKFCAKKLLHGRIYKNVTLKIYIVRSIDNHQTLGICEPDEEKFNGRRTFIIKIANTFKILRTLIILAHEMVHLAQYASGKLKHCGRSGYLTWQNKSFIDDDKTDYYDLPWEIEAHGREKGLVYQWVMTKKRYQDANWYRRIF